MNADREVVAQDGANQSVKLQTASAETGILKWSQFVTGSCGAL
jgi:hypothetical protein